MKTRILLLASLFVTTMSMQAQTVTTNEGTTHKAKDLTAHLLENATSIHISGNWDSAEMHALEQALMMTEPSESSRNTALTTVVFDPDAVIGGIGFYMCTALKTVTMPTVVNNAEVSFANAFYGCISLTSIDLSSFTNISNMSYAFSRCRALTSVKLSANGQGGGSFEQAFYNCYQLASEIDLSGFTKITNLTSAFEGCKKLTTIKMPTAVNPYEVDLSGAFYECSSLISPIDLRGFTQVRGYTSVFAYCSKLTEIYLGSASSSNNSMGGTFIGCTKDCKVYLPEGVTEVPEAWQSAPVTFMINGEPAAINSVLTETKKVPAISYVYTLDGRLVKTVPAAAYHKLAEGLNKGVYIVNHKKIVVE